MNASRLSEALARHAAVAAAWAAIDERDKQHHQRIEHLRGRVSKADRRNPWPRMVQSIKDAS